MDFQMSLTVFVALALGWPAAFGAVLWALAWRRRAGRQRQQLQTCRAQLQSLTAEREAADIATRLTQEMTAHLNEAAQRVLSETREGLFLDTRHLLDRQMEREAQTFTKAQSGMRETLAPVTDALQRYEAAVNALKEHQVAAHGQLEGQISTLAATAQSVGQEAHALATALNHRPGTAGSWGEITLRNMLERAGLAAHCDFEEQQSVGSAERPLRPDVIVRLPGDRRLAIDAKAPLKAWTAVGGAADGATHRAAIKDHSTAVRRHALRLAQKEYQSALGPRAADFVVLFLPHDTCLAAALDGDPSLVEDAAARGIILATPASLAALIRTIAMCWREERTTSRSEALVAAANTLLEGLKTVADRFNELGRHLDKAVRTYNRLGDDIERQVRRPLEAVAPGETAPAPGPDVASPRALPTPEPTGAAEGRRYASDR